MKITEIAHNCKDYFYDGDFVSSDNYVLINDCKEVFRNGQKIELEKCCSLDFPRVSIISSEQFILVDSEKPYKFGEGQANAWIINNEGKVEKSLYLGSVHKLITTSKYIVCSYTDGTLFTDWKYAQNPLVIFDFDGLSQFEYNKDVKQIDWIEMIENYSFLEKDKNTVYYLPYDSFPVVELSLKDFSSKVVLYLPNEKEIQNGLFWNPKAFTKKGEDWFFITPNLENKNSNIFKNNRKCQLVEVQNLYRKSNNTNI